MERVTGIGGIFFKAEDPAALVEWYRRHLGVEPEPFGGVIFRWYERPEAGQAAVVPSTDRSSEAPAPLREGTTVWSAFPKDTGHFAPSAAPFMINYRVRDLDAMLAQLREAGVPLVGEPESSEYGSFAWLQDPEGNKIELWQPPA